MFLSFLGQGHRARQGVLEVLEALEVQVQPGIQSYSTDRDLQVHQPGNLGREETSREGVGRAFHESLDPERDQGHHVPIVQEAEDRTGWVDTDFGRSLELLDQVEWHLQDEYEPIVESM